MVATTQHLIRESKPGHGQCVNKVAIDDFVECKGGCKSGSEFNIATRGQDNFCNCCKPEKYKPIDVKMTCEDGLTYVTQISVPESCSCSVCGEAKSGAIKAAPKNVKG